MIPAQRRAMVLDHLRQRGAASIGELCAALGASASTVRRDLDWLFEHAYIERTHGGATLTRYPQSTFEPETAIAAHTAREQKAAIAEAAAGLVVPGQSVLLDSGSTVLATAVALAARRIPLTAVTNDIAIAAALAEAPDIRVVVLGGTVRPGSTTLIGEPAETFLATVHADIGFVGAHSVSGAVLTETSLEVARMKRLMLAAAHLKVLLVDSTKFRTPAFTTICGVDEVDRIITDDGLPADAASALRDLGIAVTVVPLTVAV